MSTGFCSAGRLHVTQTAPGNELLLFLADLGAALSAIGETVDAVEERLNLIARAYGLEDARFSVWSEAQPSSRGSSRTSRRRNRPCTS